MSSDFESASDPPADVPADLPGDPSGSDHAPNLPGLLLISTPIGNLGDLSPRAAAALAGAELVLCEDTRVTATLLRAHGIRARTEALHDHNEDQRIPGLLARLAAGARIALVSDAGTPVVSDPGYRLVRAAIAAGVAVSAVPGANAAVMALVLSGLPPHPFLFLGFPPPRDAARRASFATLRAAELAGLHATMIWYESPRRLADTLADLHASFGDRPAAVARELTKRFEEVRRDTLGALAAHYATAPPRGEITLLIGPPPDDAPAPDDAAVDAQIRAALASHSARDAAALVAAATGLPRKLVYARIIALDHG